MPFLAPFPCVWPPARQQTSLQIRGLSLSPQVLSPRRQESRRRTGRSTWTTKTPRTASWKPARTDQTTIFDSTAVNQPALAHQVRTTASSRLRPPLGRPSNARRSRQQKTTPRRHTPCFPATLQGAFSCLDAKSNGAGCRRHGARPPGVAPGRRIRQWLHFHGISETTETSVDGHDRR